MKRWGLPLSSTSRHVFLTNRPEAMERVLTLAGEWRPVAISELEPGDRAVFTRLAPGDEAWILEADGTRSPDPAEIRAEEPEGGDNQPRPRPGFWHRIFLIDEAHGSQFDALRELLSSPGKAGRSSSPRFPGPIAALALTGRGFHGQRGRSWAAERGNLFLCAAMEPAFAFSSHALALTALPALVACDAIRTVGVPRSRELGIKWVNDVLLDGEKVAGVLTATQSSAGVIDSVVFGIGMNVASAPPLPATPFVPSVGCLRDHGEGDAALDGVLAAVLHAFELRWISLLGAGPEPVIGSYIEAAAWLAGRSVRIYPEGLADTVTLASWPPPEAAGTVREIRSDLGLVLEDRTEPILRGRLALEESCRALGLPALG